MNWNTLKLPVGIVGSAATVFAGLMIASYLDSQKINKSSLSIKGELIEVVDNVYVVESKTYSYLTKGSFFHLPQQVEKPLDSKNLTSIISQNDKSYLPLGTSVEFEPYSGLSLAGKMIEERSKTLNVGKDDEEFSYQSIILYPEVFRKSY